MKRDATGDFVSIMFVENGLRSDSNFVWKSLEIRVRINVLVN